MTFTEHRQHVEIINRTLNALRGESRTQYIFITWWRTPFARQALADALGLPKETVARACDAHAAP